MMAGHVDRHYYYATSSEIAVHDYISHVTSSQAFKGTVQFTENSVYLQLTTNIFLYNSLLPIKKYLFYLELMLI
jgi:hypothetical protein